MSSTINKIKDAIHLGGDSEKNSRKKDNRAPNFGDARRMSEKNTSGPNQPPVTSEAGAFPEGHWKPSQHEKTGAATGYGSQSNLDAGTNTGFNSGYNTGNGTLCAPGVDSCNTACQTPNLANQLDPRVHSTRSGQYPSTLRDGNSQNCDNGQSNSLLHASNDDPHKINLLNKLDPRVNSNMSDCEDCHETNSRDVYSGKGSHNQG